MKNFSPHIQFTELADVAEEQSPASTEAREHLATCASCSHQLEAIRQTIHLMRSDDAENAPAELVQYAKNIFRSRAVSPEPSLLRRIVASLTFDSLTAAPAFGLRSQTNAGRQLIYSTETADVEVRISPNNDEWEVAGQVLGSSCEAGDVNLAGDDLSVSAALNELCEFAFESVPPGTYKLSVQMPGLLIETPPLELGP